MTNTLSEDARKDQAELLSRFVLWSLEALDIAVQEGSDGIFAIQVPPADDQTTVEGERIEFSFVGTADHGVQLFTVECPLFGWLREQLAERGGILHAAPAIQPRSVHELTPQLFSAYHFDHGNIHLGGCTLEDRPILRLTYLHPGSANGRAGRLSHVWRTTHGQPLDPALIRSLQLDQLVAYGDRPPIYSRDEIQSWLKSSGVVNAAELPVQGDELLATTVIWCKYAEGTIVFSAAEQTLEVSFSGLAQLLASGQLKPPPAQCPTTGTSSYHLAVTDDGLVTVAEAIEVCEVSGQRVLGSELMLCPDSGRRALPEFFTTCPVSGKQVLRDALQTCSICGQSVAPSAILKGTCNGCHGLRTARKDDPRIARVLGEHPKLDRWRHWKIAEIGRVYILQASSALRRLLLVVDQETLEPLHLATGNRFFQRFTQLPEPLWSEYLKGR